MRSSCALAVPDARSVIDILAVRLCNSVRELQQCVAHRLRLDHLRLALECQQPAQERIDLMDGEDADRGAVRCTRFRLPVAVSIRPQTQRKAEANASGDGFLGRLTELPRAPARILAQ